MTHRSPARYLAPLALVGFVVALVLVVGGSGNGGEQTAAPTPTPTSTAESAQERDRRERRERRREQKKEQETYTVQAGDTPSGIAEETGVPLETLEELNPDLDPQSLAVGDEIRIR